MRVLIVKMSSMGDVVHAQPLANDLVQQYPGARVEWVVEPPFQAICAANPSVAEVISLPWRKWRRQLRDPEIRQHLRDWAQDLKARQYDVVVDCQGLLKSAIVTRLTQAPIRIGPNRSSAREGLARIAYNRPVNVPRDGHVVWRNRMHGAQGLNYPLRGPANFGFATHQLATAARADARPPGENPYVLMVSGASRGPKLWPEDDWIKLGSELAGEGLSLVWFWGSEPEAERAQRLASGVARLQPDAVQVVPPFLTVAESMSVIAGAELVVGLDTGFTHLAGALGRNTVGIFCDFDPVQCAVSGKGRCVSVGGIGMRPTLQSIREAVAAVRGKSGPTLG